jgi:hypothetical protein
MMNGGDLDEMLNEILQAMGANLTVYGKPQYAFILGDMRAVVRRIYEAGYNDCAEQFNLGVRIVADPNAQ